MSKEFRTLLGSGHVVYLDAGSKQNVQVGDYFRIIRRFDKRTISLFNRGDYDKNQENFRQRSQGDRPSRCPSR